MLQKKVDQDKRIRVRMQEEEEGCNVKYSDYEEFPWRS